MISSPVAPSGTGRPAASTTARSQPSSGRPIRTGSLAGELGTAGDDGRLGGAVGVPDLAARRDEPGASSGGQASPPMISRRTSASDSIGQSATSVGTVETTVMSLAISHGPDVDAALDQGARRGDQAGAVPPGEPHLLAARVERDRESGHHPVADTEGRLLQEHPGLGVDERRGAAVTDRDALGRAGRPGGEDHPGVVGEVRVLRLPGRALAADDDRLVVAHDGGDVGLVEDQAGALVRVVDVDRHVGGTRRGGSRGSRRRGRWCRS